MFPVPHRRQSVIGLPATIVAIVCAIALASSSTSGLVNAAQDRQRSVSVAVLDRDGAPVPDLTAAALIVREDGIAREIVRVSPAPPPTEIAILVDDSQAAMPYVRDIREALTNFVDTAADMEPAPAIRLTTFGDRPTVVTDFTPSFSAVSRGIERVMPRPNAGATFIEALVETGRDLRARKAQRPVIVAFVVEGGPEFGTLAHTDVVDALRRAGASLWTVVLTSSRGAGSSNADRERNIVLGDVTTQSGGRNHPVLASQHLPRAFETLARTLGSRYEITYGRPDTLIPPSRIEIQPRDSALTVATSRWATP